MIRVSLGVFLILLTSVCFSQNFTSISEFSKTVDKVGYYDNSHNELDTYYIELYYYLGNISDNDLIYKVITRITVFGNKTRYDLCFYEIKNNKCYHFKCDLLKQLPISIEDSNLVFYDNKKILFNPKHLSRVFNPPYGDSLFPE